MLLPHQKQRQHCLGEPMPQRSKENRHRSTRCQPPQISTMRGSRGTAHPPPGCSRLPSRMSWCLQSATSTRPARTRRCTSSSLHAHRVRSSSPCSKAPAGHSQNLQCRLTGRRRQGARPGRCLQLDGILCSSRPPRRATEGITNSAGAMSLQGSLQLQQATRRITWPVILGQAQLQALRRHAPIQLLLPAAVLAGSGHAAVELWLGAQGLVF